MGIIFNKKNGLVLLITIIVFGIFFGFKTVSELNYSRNICILKPMVLIINNAKINMEYACTETEQSKGLMNRELLEDNNGMLFVFEKEQTLSFWMKNTKIPLDILFLNNEFEVIDIQTMTPFDETAHQSAKKASMALEVNAGFVNLHGIKIGDKLEMDKSVVDNKKIENK